jgi:hypothetical protein
MDTHRKNHNHEYVAIYGNIEERKIQFMIHKKSWGSF